MQKHHSAESSENSEFFHALFGPVLADRNHFIEVRWLDGTEKPGRDFSRSVPRFIAAVSGTQELGTALIFGVHAWNARRGGGNAVDVVNCLFADIDYRNFPGGRDEALALVHGHPYGVLVESGHGLHDYAPLDSPLPLNGDGSYQRILRGYQQALRSDSVDDLGRCLRVPGNINYRDLTAPVACRIVFADDSRRYRLQDLASYASVVVDGKAADMPLRNIAGTVTAGPMKGCLVCRKPLDRANTAYCTSASRQKAYRSRSTASEATHERREKSEARKT